MMKNVLCYGGSTLRGYIPGSFNEKNGLHERYPKHIRWTGILASRLAGQYNVIEEGLAGRTTNLDEINPRSTKFSRNGLKEIWSFLDAHYPIDLVILDLGINDTKAQFNRSPEQITQGMRSVVQLIKSSSYGLKQSCPKIVVLLPLPIGLVKDPSFVMSFNQDAKEKSQKLSNLYQYMCREEKVEFFDVSQVITKMETDGLHLNEVQHEQLADGIAKKILTMLGK